MQQLLSHADLNEVGQHAIVHKLNPIMKPCHLVIMKHDACSSWMVIHQNKKFLHLYSSEPRLDYQSLNSRDTASIDDKYNGEINDPVSKIQFANCQKPIKMENRFVFTIAYALCIAMDQNISKFFKRALGDNEDTMMIRKIIVEMLKNGQLPRKNGDANNIWKNN